MARLCFWLPLGLLLAACTTWQPRPGEPAPILEEERPSRIRVTAQDGSRIVLRSPVASADSVSGFVLDQSARRSTAISAGDIELLEVPRLRSLGVWSLEGGRTAVHGQSFNNWSLQFTSSGNLRVGAAATLGGYMSLLATLEGHTAPESALSPFVGIDAGVLGEDEFGGFALGGKLGIVARLARGVGVRIVGGTGVHGGQAGPHFLRLGLEFGGP
jgi:hypothetical protein